MKYNTNKLLQLILLFMIFVISDAFSQFEVEYNEIKGAISKEDKFKSEFGWYDGFEIPLYKGEIINFIVFSEKFSPQLILVSPKGKIQSGSSQNNISSIITTIPEDGEWILYIVSKEEPGGEYILKYAFASETSIQLKSNSDFCNTLNFILEHSKAYFLLIENRFDSQKQFVKFDKSKYAFIDETNGSYTALFLESDDIVECDKLFKDLCQNAVKCIDNNWLTKNNNWHKVEDYRVKNFIITEKVVSKERFIEISLFDFKDSKQKFLNNYIVQLVINRKQ